MILALPLCCEAAGVPRRKSSSWNSGCAPRERRVSRTGEERNMKAQPKLVAR
jgi:hypothetical protein